MAWRMKSYGAASATAILVLLESCMPSGQPSKHSVGGGILVYPNVDWRSSGVDRQQLLDYQHLLD
jgi:hypothetical protein